MPVLIWATTAETWRTGSTILDKGSMSSILFRQVVTALLSWRGSSTRKLASSLWSGVCSETISFATS